MAIFQAGVGVLLIVILLQVLLLYFPSGPPLPHILLPQTTSLPPLENSSKEIDLKFQTLKCSHQ